MKITKLFTLSLLTLTAVAHTSFKTSSITGSTDVALVILSLRYNSNPTTGFGGYLRIQNIETKKRYENNSRFGMNPYLILEDIPTGRYIIENIEFNTELPYNLLFDTRLISYDTLNITQPKVYYIGSYLSFPTRPYNSVNYKVRKAKNDSEKKLIKQIKKRHENWLNAEFDYTQRIFKEGEVAINIPRK